MAPAASMTMPMPMAPPCPPPKKTSSKDSNHSSSPLRRLRSLRRSFLRNHLEQRPLVEMMQYGSVTLIHKKLDSWIDAKPELFVHHYSAEDVDGGKMKLDDTSSDHLSRRVSSLCGRRNKLARSWSGNIGLIHKDSLIDALPEQYHHQNALLLSTGSGHKRSKPRRVSGVADTLLTMRKHIHPKDVLLDGDLQTVRKVVLEKKLRQRPLIPNANELDSTTELVPEIRLLRQLEHDCYDHDRLPHFYTLTHQNKQHGGGSSPLRERHGGIHRATSCNSAMLHKRQHIRVMPSSA